jgi:hypothetical protein
MSTDPNALPASEEEQFHEVARLLGVALVRWHKLHRGTVGTSDRSNAVPGTTKDVLVKASRAEGG